MRRLLLLSALLAMSFLLPAAEEGSSPEETVPATSEAETSLRAYADELYERHGRDAAKAIELYRKLAENRNAPESDRAWSAYRLGRAYEEGIHVKRDQKLSGLYYRLAWSLGSKEAGQALEEMDR